jgi:DNA-binding CsgD family transcriptional regulator
MIESLETLVPEPATFSWDDAYKIISDLLGVVRASRWAFARVEPDGRLISISNSHADSTGLESLSDELQRQRAKVSTGPRIAATLGSLSTLESGMTLVFADAQTDFGILTLLRTRELGPFTSSEISTMTLALDAVSDQLSLLRVPLTELRTRIADWLPGELEESVQQLTAAWSDDNGTAQPFSYFVVRTEPISGPTDLVVGVRIDRFRRPDSLARVAERFHLSSRQLQVLTLILDGDRLDQIAARLRITTSTVQVHIESLLDKTESENCSKLIARVMAASVPA